VVPRRQPAVPGRRVDRRLAPPATARGRLPAAEALVGAYRHYRCVCEPPHRISFDRAFDLAAHTDAQWITGVQSFALVVCPACHSEFLADCGSIARSNDECPFCRLIKRYETDQRVQASFPARPLVDLTTVSLGTVELMRRQRS
jgi:flagellar transcriptional activator FlhC